MRKTTLILATFIVIFCLPPLSAKEFFIMAINDSTGIESNVARKLNDTFYHKFFSLGKGPFLPSAGLNIKFYTHNLVFGGSLFQTTSPGKTTLGAPANLVA